MEELNFKYVPTYKFYLKAFLKTFFYKNHARLFLLISILAISTVIILFQYDIASIISGVLIGVALIVFTDPLFTYLRAKKLGLKHLEYNISPEKISIIAGNMKAEYGKSMIKKIKIYSGFILMNLSTFCQLTILFPANEKKQVEAKLKSMKWTV